MFANEFRTVKKKCVVDSFEILQEIATLSKKEENIKNEYNKKMKELKKRKKRDRKNRIVVNKLGVNMVSVISAKYNNFLSILKENKKECTRKSSDDGNKSEKTIFISVFIL